MSKYDIFQRLAMECAKTSDEEMRNLLREAADEIKELRSQTASSWTHLEGMVVSPGIPPAQRGSLAGNIKRLRDLCEHRGARINELKQAMRCRGIGEFPCAADGGEVTIETIDMSLQPVIIAQEGIDGSLEVIVRAPNGAGLYVSDVDSRVWSDAKRIGRVLIELARRIERNSAQMPGCAG